MAASLRFCSWRRLGSDLAAADLPQFNTTRDFALAAAMSNVLLATAIACLILQIRLLRRKGVEDAMSTLNIVRDRLPAWILGAFTGLFFAFMLAPILIVVWMAFSAQSFIGFPITSYSLRWFYRVVEYEPFLNGSDRQHRNRDYLDGLAALLGVPAALALARSRSRWLTVSPRF